jgi:hypothetical protein
LLSSISQSKKSSSRHSAGAAHTVAAKRAKIQGRKGTHPVYDKHGDEVIDDNEYDNDEDHLSVTNASCAVSSVEPEREVSIDAKAAELIEKHCQEFMKRAFLLRVFCANPPLTTASAMIKMGRPQSDIAYIIYCLRNWQVGVNYIKTMEHCPEKDRIARF